VADLAILRREPVFDNFVQSYHTFREGGVAEPLLETLRLFDILSAGALQDVDSTLPALLGVDLTRVVQQRKEGMPFEYAIGKAYFMGLEFTCSPDALIPRKETELLVQVALDLVGLHQDTEALTVVDMGTGCANIAVSVAMNASNVKVLACDISPEAVELAQQNIESHNLQDRISLFCGDLYSPLCEQGYAGKIDLILCNPPYIPKSSLSKLASEIIDYEPKLALDAGPYGINILRRLIRESQKMLRPGGALAFQIGGGQHELVTRLLQGTRGYTDIQYFDDGAEIRVISTTKKAEGQ
jgi:release factor glutamine methyltransferase